ncbi:hypothetical protein ABUK73_05025 [Agrobacterium sp. BA1120]|uniref:hypothetical protein n=1 Tax=Agrobacterium sp. BA1120 TaxID=3228927 RepID=UPI003369E07D
MTIEGKGFSLETVILSKWYSGNVNHNSVVDFVCTRDDSDGWHFEPIQYEPGRVPEGRVQGEEGFNVPAISTAATGFDVNVELTKKIQSGVLSSKR